MSVPAKDILAGTRLDPNSPARRLKNLNNTHGQDSRKKQSDRQPDGQEQDGAYDQLVPAQQQKSREHRNANQSRQEPNQAAARSAKSPNAASNAEADQGESSAEEQKRDSGSFISRLFDFSSCANSRKGNKSNENPKNGVSAVGQKTGTTAASADTGQPNCSKNSAPPGKADMEASANDDDGQSVCQGAAGHDQHPLREETNANPHTLWHFANTAGGAQQALGSVGDSLIGVFQCGQDGRDTARSHISIVNDAHAPMFAPPANQAHMVELRRQDRDHLVVEQVEHVCTCLGFSLAKSAGERPFCDHTCMLLACTARIVS